MAGCSAVRIGYNQAPTLAWWWLDGYMDFDADQAPKVKDALNQWFAWHRATQLPDYADLLAAAQAQVLRPATAQQVCSWAEDLRSRLGAAFAQGVPLAADLLPALKPEQLAHLERRYRKSNHDFEDEYLQQDSRRTAAGGGQAHRRPRRDALRPARRAAAPARSPPAWRLRPSTRPPGWPSARRCRARRCRRWPA